jgi:hypothetical protein
MDTAKSMISLDREVAEDCNYLLTRREKDGGTKYIEGPSIRLLEIAATSYGNLRYGSRILTEDATAIICQGVAHDLENNVAVSVEVRRRITTKEGRRYGDDMITTNAMAGGAIARRNALNGVVPRAYVNQLAEFAKEVAKGDIASLPQRRQKAFDYYQKVLGIDRLRVLQFLDRESLEDVNLDDLVKLSSLKTALHDRETTLDEAFPSHIKPPSAPIFPDKKPEPDVDPNPTMTKPRERKSEPGPRAQDILATWWCEECGRTWDQFQTVLENIGDNTVAELTGFSDLHGQTARKYLNAKTGLNAQFEQIFPGGTAKQEGELPM